MMMFLYGKAFSKEKTKHLTLRVSDDATRLQPVRQCLTLRLKLKSILLRVMCDAELSDHQKLLEARKI
jgi:hypothetical protein